MKIENTTGSGIRPANSNRPGRYDAVFDEIRRCETGEGVCVTPDDGQSLKHLRDRIAQAATNRRQRDATTPKVAVFVTDDDRVAVIRR